MPDEPARAPLDEAEYHRLLRTADSNRVAARTVADAGAHHIACTLGEQAAQCALEALLHGLGAAREAYGHGLVRLAEHAAGQVEADLEPSLRAALQRLTQLYLPSRYPDALPEGSPVDSYGSEHSAQALQDADAVMAFVDRLWGAVVEEHAAAEREGVMRPAAVLRRRRAERDRLLGVARTFVAGLPDTLGVRATVVFGSVARGDFNAHSDIDVLVIADGVGDDYWQRLRALGEVPAGVEVVVWSPREWRVQRDRGNRIAVESERDGVWLVGDAAAAAADPKGGAT